MTKATYTIYEYRDFKRFMKLLKKQKVKRIRATIVEYATPSFYRIEIET